MSLAPVISHANAATPCWLPANTVLPPGATGPTGPSGGATGPTGATGSASTVTGPTGPASTVTGPTGPPASFTFDRGTFTSSGANGSQVVTLAVPYPSTNYTVLPVMADSIPAEVSVVVLSGSQFEVYWQNAAGGSHTFAWLTAG